MVYRLILINAVSKIYILSMKIGEQKVKTKLIEVLLVLENLLPITVPRY